MDDLVRRLDDLVRRLDDLVRRLVALEQELEQMRAAAIPAGAVQAFAVRTAPEGWLPCDGREISRQHYARLFQAIGTTFGDGDGETTFHLPDLQGVFVRGWDSWGDIDPEREFGSLQEDAFEGHRHASLGHRHDAVCQSAGEHTHALDEKLLKTIDSWEYRTIPEIGRGVKKETAFSDPDYYLVKFPQKSTQTSGAHAHSVSVNEACEAVASSAQADCGDPRVDTETRPKNLALLYCIKT